MPIQTLQLMGCGFVVFGALASTLGIVAFAAGTRRLKRGDSEQLAKWRQDFKNWDPAVIRILTFVDMSKYFMCGLSCLLVGPTAIVVGLQYLFGILTE